MSPQVWRGHALRVETQAGALSQPLRKPGHVAVTLQVVGVQATVGGGEEEEEQVEEGKEERGEADRWGEQVGGEIIDLRMGRQKQGGWRRERCEYRSINQLYKRPRMRGILPRRDRNVYQGVGGATYKVLSFGMWLKLATDSRLMLLLLRVLAREKSGKHNSRQIHWTLQGCHTNTEK